MHTLFLTRQFPYPPVGGAALRNWQNMNIFMKFSEVSVFCVGNRPRCISKDEITTPPWISSFISHEIHSKEETANKIKKLRRIKEKLKWLDFSYHPLADKYFTQKAAMDLRDFIISAKPDILVIEELWLFHYLETIKDLPCHVIYDSHNVNSLLFKEIQLASSTPQLSSVQKRKKQSLIKRAALLEKRIISQSDQTWVCSEDESKAIQQLYGSDSEINLVPNGVDISSYQPVRIGQLDYSNTLDNNALTIAFTATFSYPPNSNSANTLIDDIFPLLREKYPSCRLLLVGRGPTQYMQESSRKTEGIIVTGEVPDVFPYLAAASVIVVPLQQGSGTRLKILEAFAAGRPVVSTTKGAEGINAVDGQHLLIRESPVEIVLAIEQLWSDESLKQRLIGSGYRLIVNQYSWDAIGEHVEQLINPST